MSGRKRERRSAELPSGLSQFAQRATKFSRLLRCEANSAAIRLSAPQTLVTRSSNGGSKVETTVARGKGFRGRSPADADALVEAIVAFSGMVCALRDELQEAEINPLFVLPQGRGVVAAVGVVIGK